MPNDSDISVDVKTSYIDTQSSEQDNRFVFSYTIKITNSGAVGAKLLTRHWLVTDANGKVQEVHGEGVVGEQPHLQPGETYEYTSGTILETSIGTMGGSYQMIDDKGQPFDATVDEFVLSIPRTLH